MLIILIVLVLLWAAGIVYLAQKPWPKQPIQEDRNDPEALLKHLQTMDGCTCRGDGIPTMASYYCGVHGDEMRKKFPNADALRAELAKRGVPIEEEEAVNADETEEQDDLDLLIDALSQANTDGARVAMIQMLPTTTFSSDDLVEILLQFDTDAGRNQALPYLACSVSDRTKAILKIGEAYDTDNASTRARQTLTGR